MSVSLEAVLFALPALAALALCGARGDARSARAGAGATAALCAALAVALWALPGLRANARDAALRADELGAPPLAAVCIAACALVWAMPGRELSAPRCAALLWGQSLAALLYTARAPALLAAAAAASALPALLPLLRRSRGEGGKGADRCASAAALLALGGLALGAGAYGLAAVAAAADDFALWPWAALLALGALLQLGALPLHGLLPFLFERGALGSAVLFAASLPGPYLVARLGLASLAPVRGAELLGALALASALAGALLGLLQSELRRSLGCFALTTGALLLAALASGSAQAAAAALLLWCAFALLLSGGALGVWAIEARTGCSDARALGGIARGAPALASAALLFSLAAAGLPGSPGFAADELLLRAWLEHSPAAALCALAAGALTAIHLVRAQLRACFGPGRVAVPRDLLARERAALALLAAPLLLLGVWPAALLHAGAAAAAARAAARQHPAVLAVAPCADCSGAGDPSAP